MTEIDIQRWNIVEDASTGALHPWLSRIVE
jgi:hypothetical protein